MLKHGQSFSNLPKAQTPGLTSLQSHFYKNRFGDESKSKHLLDSGLADLPSPFLLPDLENALEILKEHISSEKTILLYGDRDCDGVSSTTLLGAFLRKIHRGTLIIRTSSDEDYGLCADAMRNVREAQPNLLVTLDFGTSNAKEIQELSDENIKTIVLDHHEIPQTIAPNCCLVSPKRQDSIYPGEKICTSVLAWKFIVAWLYDSLPESKDLVWVGDGETLFSGWLVRKGVNLFHGDRAQSEILYPGNYVEWQHPVDKIHPERQVFYSQLLKYPAVLQEILENLDLAAIGTITDMMPLSGENRIIVLEGCRTLQKIQSGNFTHRPGLSELIKLSDINPKRVLSKDIGWTIGPALNAAGRMHQTKIALDLLLSKSSQEALPLAKDLLKLNDERKERTQRNLFKVDAFLKRKKERTERSVLFCYEPDFEPGVSGIVATRLVEQYKRPVIFITPDHGHAKGSVRAWGSENVLNLLKKADGIFLQYGGHKEAAGFSLAIDKIPDLAAVILKESDNWLKEEQDIEAHSIEESLVSLNPSELKEKIYDELGIFEPFGQENPTPLLSIKGAKILSYRPLSDGKHAKFKILTASDSIHCVIWNSARELSHILKEKGELDLWGHLEESTYRSKTSLQFVVTFFK
ncbi:single-stranded-DNA-specific exonuclease RecJ [Leptospira perolatii]|uniref:Single-stranded-DNA-specific exonuclease RecJ n=1 Tax=Leptospira perolatii TaxID=2023191 RepID=A0A2M9ZLD0_9LEPT|nr:single-stranded-DNA-specific exonuclease RecJ [Leptospira perolatii]PJZ70335.1 single-stranded-DNA-specific exonuclease RecJ [Leptospira perolatii]PJZ72781.1 single-stranded-DNA-specific exonuclease RecJ [Leptospira perolatii]